MHAKALLLVVGVSVSAVVVGQLTASPQFSPLIAPAPAPLASMMGEGNVYDVTPCRIFSLNQHGRTGQYPHGTVGLAMATVGQNVGNVELPWYSSPGMDHPVISQHMYRITTEGRLEQVGYAWLKHGFGAVQGTTCGSCDSSGTNTRLGVGCSDTYGGNLNSLQYWLGPRGEVKPNQHIWMDGLNWAGSHFETDGGGNSDPGDSRQHNGVEHRMRVRMGDLTTSGATYYYEGAYYLLKDLSKQEYSDLQESPAALVNNARHQLVTIVHDGSGNFQFDEVGSTVGGPVISQWGDVQSTAMPDDEGLVYVSSRAVDLGDGSHRYEYAIMNFSLDREISSFALPVGSAAVTDIGFHCPVDGYWTSASTFVNESIHDTGAWESAVGGGVLTFTPPEPAGGFEPNTIRYGTLYTFWFTSAAAPGAQSVPATMLPYREGSNESFAADVVAPEAPAESDADLTALTVVRGTLLGGGLPEAQTSDDAYVRTRSGFGNSLVERHSMEMLVGADTDLPSPTLIDIAVEARIDQPSGTARLSLRNWNTGEFEVVRTGAIGMAEGTLSIEDVPAANYVDATGQIELSIKHIVFSQFFAFNFQSFIDHVQLTVSQ